MGGPCSAWPVFSRNDYDHFRERVGLYIDQLGGKTDFLSWHIYSTVHDDGDLESHSSGANTDWQLDLVENYAMNRTGREIPFDFHVDAETSPVGMVMRWNASPSFNYAVKKSTNLSSGAWISLDSLPGTGLGMTYTNAITDPQGFYKVEAVLP